MAGTQASSGRFPWLAAYPEAVDWFAPLPVWPVPSILDGAIERFADKPCIDFLSRKFSYAEIGRLVARFAMGLQRLGIVKGDRVGLALPNTPYSVIAYYGALKAGAIVVNFNPLYAEREMRRQIESSGVRLIVTVDIAQIYDKLAPMIDSTKLERLVICRVGEMLPFGKRLVFPIAKRRELADFRRDEQHIPFERLIRNPGEPAAVPIDPKRDLAVIQYTGGTTGPPKGAMLTHANLAANVDQTALWFADAHPGAERMIGVLPLFHVFAMTVIMNLGLKLGAELILLPRFELKQLLATIARTKATLFPAVPTIYTAINTSEFKDRYDLTSIRYCLSGGAPLPLDVREAFEARTGAVLREGYGVTEASPVAICTPLSGHIRPGSVGLPLPGTEVKIVDLEDSRMEVAPGEKGEICLRGPQVMTGYWKNPEATAQALRAGWLHTGDVGIMDDEGFVRIVDRINDVILCSGYNVYPRDVEEVLYMHSAVEECVVAGVPDPYRGQTVKAYITLKTGSRVTADQLHAYLADKLSPIEMPKHFEFRTSLPRTMIGKLSRQALLEEERQRAEQAA